MIKLKRILAALIDYYISYVVILGLCIILKSFILSLLDFDRYLILTDVVWYISIAFKDIVFKNASIGKKIVGIKIVKNDGDIPKWYVIILRNILIPFMFIIDFITIIFLNKRLADIIFNTKVV